MKERDNLSVVIHQKNDLRMEQTPLPPDPEPDDVQLATHTVGICGSDIHFWTHGRIQQWIVEKPIISGHETSATVCKVGSNVRHLKIGDRVAVEPGISCMDCDICKTGRYNLCPKVSFHACPPTDGSLRRYFNHRASFCHKLPDNVSHGEGALMEPLSIAAGACIRAKIKVGMGQKVLVTGAGPVGLLAALTAKSLGADKVCITDINHDRLLMAKKLGIDCTVHIDPKDTNINSTISRINNSLGDNPDITLECSGVESSISLAIYCTKDGGSIMMVGLNAGNVNIPLANAACREISLIGVKRARNTFPLVINLVSNGHLNIKPLITHIYKLENSADAFEHTRTQRDGAVKVQIECFE